MKEDTPAPALPLLYPVQNKHKLYDPVTVKDLLEHIHQLEIDIDHLNDRIIQSRFILTGEIHGEDIP